MVRPTAVHLRYFRRYESIVCFMFLVLLSNNASLCAVTSMSLRSVLKSLCVHNSTMASVRLYFLPSNPFLFPCQHPFEQLLLFMLMQQQNAIHWALRVLCYHHFCLIIFHFISSIWHLFLFYFIVICFFIAIQIAMYIYSTFYEIY